MPSSKISRHSYHHGDLANALTGAALDLARAGGPDAVVLREAARQIGVSATAAYRHFSSRDELMHAVKDCALVELAERMQEELERVPADVDTVTRLTLSLRALGAGYIGFALDNPGLFRTAFTHAEPMTGRQGLDPMQTEPFLMLVGTLDSLAEQGVLAAQRRPFLELAAWGTVHGMAELLLDGPMRHLPPEVQRAAVDRALDMVIDGIMAARS
ncbi:TetR/AcrR family transcriptional regulator [Dactylosporangium sp. NPDC048998]|uniref:TetR/AcrR family transcriptional regulator n=1 Tax=Dactylosporangium sp. NPDC048998 TaxID=3363976 RepID=UPI00371F1347